MHQPGPKGGRITMPLPTKNVALPHPIPLGVRWGLALALLLVLGLRLWHLAAGLPDYDSVRCWQVVRALAAGEGSQLFFSRRARIQPAV